MAEAHRHLAGILAKVFDYSIDASEPVINKTILKEVRLSYPFPSSFGTTKSYSDPYHHLGYSKGHF